VMFLGMLSDGRVYALVNHCTLFGGCKYFCLHSYAFVIDSRGRAHTNAFMNATIPVRIPSDMLDRLDAIARRQHNSRNGVIRQSIEFFTDAWSRAETALDQEPAPSTDPAPQHEEAA